jgi:SAM-dependent methyltransferase
VDLGGLDLGHDAGALVASGYPYPFEQLTVVDLPSDERHALYRTGRSVDRVETPLGPVDYRYQSMADLSAFAGGQTDLVYSGESIEHVHPDEARTVMAEIHRILRPGGWLALDTPNAAVTRLQQDDFIDPDHKVEYTWSQLAGLLRGAGFDIRWAKGLNLARGSRQSGRFDVREVVGNVGLYDSIEDCYLLAVVAQKPAGGA